MAIDKEALRIAAQGEPDDKVTVKRRWLREVHRTIDDLERQLAAAQARKRASDSMSGIFGTAFGERMGGHA